MKQKFLVLNLLIIIITTISLAGCAKKKEIMPKKEIFNSKKAVLIIAYQGFKDKEYTDTRKALEDANIKVKVASSQNGQAEAKDGLRVLVDMKLDDINVDNFDAVIFIGGPGAEEYVNNKLAHQIAQDAINKNKILGAICIAPEILAKANVLKGKNATVWSMSPWIPSFGKNPIDVLKEEGANYLDKPVVVDENIVTANGPQSASQFGEKIADLLK